LVLLAFGGLGPVLSLVVPVALVPAVVGIGAGCPLQVALVLSVVGAVGVLVVGDPGSVVWWCRLLLVALVLS
jgi:hypothetical protein